MPGYRLLLAALLLLSLLLAPSQARAMGSAFTYQGTLEDQGLPAHGLYDFHFRLLDSIFNTAGSNFINEVPVSEGVFTVELDFGPGLGLYPGTFVRYLRIGIRPAGSTDPYEVLSPDTQLHPVPYARRAEAVNPGAILNISIVDNAVNSRVLADGSVQSAHMATNAIATASIANAAVTTAKINDGAVTAAKIADGAITNAKLANGAVTNNRIASSTITLSRMAGVRRLANIGAVNLSGGQCANTNFGVTGAQVGDIPFVTLTSESPALPEYMSLTAVRVLSEGVVQLRICNHGSTPASWSILNLFFVLLR